MSTIDGSLFVKQLTCAQFTPPAACITDAAIVANAKVAASKLQHRFQPTYSQASASASAAERKVVHVVRGLTATVNAIGAGSRTLCTSTATITVDVYKNGTTILSAPVVLDNANTAYILEAATISSASLVVGDVLEVVVTVAAGGGAIGNGVFVNFQIDEDAN